MTRKMLYVIGGSILAVVGIATLALFLVDVNTFKPQIESAAETALGRKVALGQIRLALLSGGMTVDDVSIAEDPKYGSGSFLRARSIVVGVEVWPLLLARHLRITGVAIEAPELTLRRAPSGAWNFSSLGATNTAVSGSPSLGNLSVQTIKINDGRLIVADIGEKATSRAYEHVNLAVSNFSSASSFPFEFSATTPGNGRVKLSGRAGPLSEGEVAQTPFDGALEVRGLDVAAFAGPSSDIGAVLDFAGTLSSDGREAHSKGMMTVNKLKLASGGSPARQPVVVHYQTTYDLKREAGSFTQGDVQIGKAVAHLTGTFTNSGETAVIAMKVNGVRMPATDLESILPTVGVTLPAGASLQSGTVDVDLAMTGSVDKIVTTGPVSLSNAKLAGFGLGEQLAVLSSFASLPRTSDTVIQTFSCRLRVAPDGIRADTINLVVPTIGSLTGSGTIANDQRLNFQMVARVNVSASPISRVGAIGGLGSIVGGKTGSSGIPFRIQGTTTKPVFVPDVGALAGRVAEEAVGKAPKTGSALENLKGLFGAKKKQ